MTGKVGDVVCPIQNYICWNNEFCTFWFHLCASKMCYQTDNLSNAGNPLYIRLTIRLRFLSEYLAQGCPSKYIRQIIYPGLWFTLTFQVLIFREGY